MLIVFKQRKTVMEDVLGDNKVGNSDVIESVCQTCLLHADDALPVYCQINLLYRVHQLTQVMFTFELNRRYEFRQNEIVSDDQSIFDQLIQ